MADSSNFNIPIEDKARLLTGRTWTTFANEAIGLRELSWSDGPHGLRKVKGEGIGLGDEVEATCFPPLVTLGSTWDRTLAYRMGAAIGFESHMNNVDVLLGPGINLKRSPLCGRNFEYVSEDPLFSGYIGAAYVNGIQSNKVAASLKHFAANNQESRRMNVDAIIDERTYHELYLRSYQIVVELANPWTIMCSYNLINGTYASENRDLLTTILRERWGYSGLVVSDWGAVVNRARAVTAGLDVEMPNSADGPQIVVDAVRDGSLDEADVDLSIQRLMTLAERTTRTAPTGAINFDEHHELARDIAAAGIVLLKNDGILPLKDTAGQKVAVIGEFAGTPRAQGGGSSRVNAVRNDDALSALTARLSNSTVTYAQGFRTAPTGDDDALRAEAVSLATNADVVVMFLGLGDMDESEGFDRTTIAIPANQITLLREVARANAKVVVCLTNGALVDIASWSDSAQAVVEAWLGGQAGGSAVCDVLVGDVNPSGRLTETIAYRLEDIPAQMNFPGEFDKVVYGEGPYVGYRHFTTHDQPVAYPFGFGLSYTTFSFSDVAATVKGPEVDVTLNVNNLGDRDGHEVVQVYVSKKGSAVIRPAIELKGFERVAVTAKGSTHATVTIPVRYLAYWDTRIHDWVVEPGEYTFHVGSSADNLTASVTVSLHGDVVTVPLDDMSTLQDWMATAKGKAAVLSVFASLGGNFSQLGEEGSTVFEMLTNIRLNQAMNFLSVPITPTEMVARLNAEMA
jgi:beta-glucosidase